MSDLQRPVSGLVAVFVILYSRGKLQNKIIFYVLVCRRKAHSLLKMQRSGRASLGMLSGRLQGGFSASSLPRSRPSGHVAGENAVITVAVPSPSASNSEIPSNQSQEGTSSSDIQTQFYRWVIFCELSKIH